MVLSALKRGKGLNLKSKGLLGGRGTRDSRGFGSRGVNNRRLGMMDSLATAVSSFGGDRLRFPNRRACTGGRLARRGRRLRAPLSQRRWRAGLEPCGRVAIATPPCARGSDDGDRASSGGSAEATSSTARGSGKNELAFGLLSVVAGCGALETAYLTFSKLFVGSVLCPTAGCETILESRYSEILGVPVSLFGFFTYSSVAYLSYLTSRGRGDYRGSSLAGSTVLASVSAFLAYVLFTQFTDETCAWCLASCAFSFSALGLAIWGNHEVGADPVKTTMPPLFASPLIVGTLVAVFADPSQAGEDFELPYKEPEVTTQSTKETLSLAQKLKKIDAKMYGAFWCSHCFDQKQAFGKEAMKDFPYVECFPAGYKKGIKQEQACETADVKGFPTWIIKGEKLEGDQELQVLEATADKYLAELPKVQPSFE